MAIGEKTYRFINSVNKAKSYLGTLSTDNDSPIYCVGDELYLDGSVAKIYKRKEFPISQQVFEGDFGIDIANVVNNYKASLNDENKEKNITVDDINSRKYQIIPFKPDTVLEVKVTDDRKRSKIEKTKVSTIRWGVRESDEEISKKKKAVADNDEGTTDENTKSKRGRKKTSKEESESSNIIEYQELTTRIEDSKTNKRLKVNIEEYGKTYNVAGFVTAKPKGFGKNKILDMTPYGFFRPIAVRVEGVTFVVDCDGLYIYKGDEVKDLRDVHKAGDWVSICMKENNKIKEFKAESAYKKYIKDLCSYVGTCREYIAPFGSTKCNLIII